MNPFFLTPFFLTLLSVPGITPTAVPGATHPAGLRLESDDQFIKSDFGKRETFVSGNSPDPNEQAEAETRNPYPVCMARHPDDTAELADCALHKTCKESAAHKDGSLSVILYVTKRSHQVVFLVNTTSFYSK